MLTVLKQWFYGRRHPRVISQPAHPVGIVIDLHGQQYKTAAWDVSVGGVGFRMQGDPLEGEEGKMIKLKVALPFPSEQVIQVKAVLKHATEYMHGAEFMGVAEDELKHLVSYIEYMIKRFPESETWGKRPSLKALKNAEK